MSDCETSCLIAAIHERPERGVIAVTGGGSRAIGWLLQVPGASRTVIEAVVPYAYPALQQWVGGTIDSACCEATARAMAMSAIMRARQLDDGSSGEPFGVGATASLASDRPKRGDHRIHVALQTLTATFAWSLTLAKGARTREEEEAIAANLVLHAVAVACNLAPAAGFAVAEADDLVCQQTQAPWLWIDMVFGDSQAALVNPAVDRCDFTAEPRCEQALMPGSFSPPHQGHRRMVEHAQQRLGKRVTLELALANVDKPPVDYIALEERLSAIAAVFPGQEAWLTRLPTFVMKAKHVHARHFVVGVDTIRRIADPRYYDGDDAKRDADVSLLADMGVRFLVFGRLVDSHFQTLSDLPLPEELMAICDEVTEAEFREDASSTAMRGLSP